MLNTLEEINKRIDIINEMLPKFETTERKEIKKNNKQIEELTKELTDYKDIIFKELVKKKEQELPKNNTELLKEKQEELSELEKGINFLEDKSYIVKLEFNKNIYDIENSNNLEEINKIITEILNKFKLINIELNIDNFKYSITTYKYMNSYFNNLNKDSFNEEMKNTFDTLYWENPNLINHLALSLRELTNSYKKEFENYIQNQNNNKTYDEELPKYYNLKIELDNLTKTNKYLNYNLFITKKDNIDNYLNNSQIKKDNISKIVDYNNYLNFTDIEKNSFIKEIRGLYHSVNEYNYLSSFDFLIKKGKEIYASKETNKNNLANNLKTIKSLTKQKDKLTKKIFKLYPKLDKNTRINNKYNDLQNKTNNKILEISSSYKEYDKLLFENDIITKLNDNSTYYDLLKLYQNNYQYLMNIFKENNLDISKYEEFNNFISSAYLTIANNLLITSNIDIKEKLIEKYSLFNINIKLEDNTINELKKNLEYLNTLSYFEEANLDLEKIKLITEIDKLLI